MNSAVALSSLDLSLKQLEEVQLILHSSLPGCTVWAFGSRVRGNAKKYSDLDLVLVASKPLALETLADLTAMFDESDLPFKVDLLDWATTSESFRKIIEAEKVVLQIGSDAV